MVPRLAQLAYVSLLFVLLLAHRAILLVGQAKWIMNSIAKWANFGHNIARELQFSSIDSGEHDEHIGVCFVKVFEISAMQDNSFLSITAFERMCYLPSAYMSIHASNPKLMGALTL